MNLNSRIVLTFLITITWTFATAQTDRWQQRAEYQMEIDFDVNTHRFTGKQTLKLYNNSPDELNRVFYHLYFNAFQPGSMMDIRNQSLPDADPRVAGRIGVLEPNEIGYHKVTSLKHDGEPVDFETVGTILEVDLKKAIAPNSTAVFEMEFESQVPVQIRRSGRDNKEGISYSMSQWYPKMCEYDYQGWHANPYIGREFHGIWGDFDVKIAIDKNYTIGATGYLQNPKEIGHGYESDGNGSVGISMNNSSNKLTWHFNAPNVHDFVWGADPDYKHTTFKREDGTVMHFFFQPGEKTNENWANLPKVMDRAFDFINKTYGQYPYKQYSFIQGGDGGMEYPMATLITGERPFSSLVGVSVHELMHSWYQMVLGTNESLYAWMDEGFTSYASAEVMNFLKKEGLIPGSSPVDDPHINSIKGYARWNSTGFEEPLSTHADHFQRNQAYGVAAYTKGSVVLSQLNYILGKETFDRAMLKYYDTWKFKHPNANDFFRVMEKESGLELDWFKEYFIYTTHTIDYSVGSVQSFEKKKTKVTLQRNGVMPMPIDVMVTYTNGDKELIHFPLTIMRGAKQEEVEGATFKVGKDWSWVNSEFEFVLDTKLKKIANVEIDPSNRMADVNADNNGWVNKP